MDLVDLGSKPNISIKSGISNSLKILAIGTPWGVPFIYVWMAESGLTHQSWKLEILMGFVGSNPTPHVTLLFGEINEKDVNCY